MSEKQTRSHEHLNNFRAKRQHFNLGFTCPFRGEGEYWKSDASATSFSPGRPKPGMPKAFDTRSRIGQIWIQCGRGRGKRFGVSNLSKEAFFVSIRWGLVPLLLCMRNEQGHLSATMHRAINV